MAYTPNTWATGDTITAAKLNNMEQGIANSGVFFIEATWDDNANEYVLDKTLAEISAAYSSGRICKIVGGIDSEMQVAVAPFGTLYAITPVTTVDIFSNVLISTYYDVNPQTEFVTSTDVTYTLTPAS